MTKLQVTQLLTNITMPRIWLTKRKADFAEVGSDVMRVLVHCLYRVGVDGFELPVLFAAGKPDTFYFMNHKADAMGPYAMQRIQFDDRQVILQYKFYYKDPSFVHVLVEPLNRDHRTQVFLLYDKTFYKISTGDYPHSNEHMTKVALILKKLGRDSYGKLS